MPKTRPPIIRLKGQVIGVGAGEIWNVYNISSAQGSYPLEASPESCICPSSSKRGLCISILRTPHSLSSPLYPSSYPHCIPSLPIPPLIAPYPPRHRRFPQVGCLLTSVLKARIPNIVGTAKTYQNVSLAVRGVQRKYLYRFICISGSWEADARRGKNCYVSVSFFHCLEDTGKRKNRNEKKKKRNIWDRVRKTYYTI